MKAVATWLEAARLRTLPLASSGILLGSALAAYYSTFHYTVFLLALLTALLLQILSNLANDLGDSQHGADHSTRQGPQRTVQAGLLTPSQMWRAIVVVASLAFISGLLLLYIAFITIPPPQWVLFVLFLLMGIAAIWAAIRYTLGQKPYGYQGWGDLSVWLFFGIIAVSGSFFLHARQLPPTPVWLAAAACGFWSTAVLNLNNLRDIHSDQQAGKYSIAVRLGFRSARHYHWALLAAGMLCLFLAAYMSFSNLLQYIFLLTYIGFLKHLYSVWQTSLPQQLDSQLKPLAINIFFCILLFSWACFYPY